MLTVVAREGSDRRWKIEGSQCVGSNKDGETGVFLFARREMKTGGWGTKKEKEKYFIAKQESGSNSFGPTTARSQTSYSVPTYRPRKKKKKIRTEELRWSGAARKWSFHQTESCHKSKRATKDICCVQIHPQEIEWQSHHIFPQHKSMLFTCKKKKKFIHFFFCYIVHKPENKCFLGFDWKSCVQIPLSQLLFLNLTHCHIWVESNVKPCCHIWYHACLFPVCLLCLLPT